MIERLNVSERIIHMSSASVVSPGMEQCGEILVSRTAMYFVGEQVTIDMNQVRDAALFFLALEILSVNEKSQLDLALASPVGPLTVEASAGYISSCSQVAGIQVYLPPL